MAALTRRERAAVGRLVAAPYLYVVEPLVVLSRELAELTPAREATLEARRRHIAQRPRLSEELNGAGRGFEEQAEHLLPGPTPPPVASDLQKVVKEAAAAANAEVRSKRVLPPADLVGLQEVPIEPTVAGNMREIRTFLYQIERKTRLLTARDIKVALVAMGQPRDLLTTLIVAGCLLPSAAGAGTN